jgi:uncharacterized surface protein with fasciclin (FAS1) repeats
MVTFRRSLGALAAVPLIAPLLPPIRSADAQTQSVIDTLAADGRFVLFLELIGRAGLTDQLHGLGPFTVFAPTDQVFGGALTSQLDNLLTRGVAGGSPASEGSGSRASGPNPDALRLSAVVGYFIMLGQALTLAQLTALDNQQLQTMNGMPIVVRVRPGQMPIVAGAGGLNIVPPVQIVQADIIATNGIIHVLGGIRFP